MAKAAAKASIDFLTKSIANSAAVMEASTTRMLCLAHDLATAVTPDKFIEKDTFKFMHSDGEENRRAKTQLVHGLDEAIKQSWKVLHALENWGGPDTNLCILILRNDIRAVLLS